MNSKRAVLVTVALSFLIVQAYVGLGLGHRLTPLVQASLWVALAGTCLGLIAGLTGRTRSAIFGWGLAGLILVGLQVDFEMSQTESRANTAKANRMENELRLANAEARVPCDNGDIATLQMSNNPGTVRFSLSIQIVPANPAEKGYILTSTSGEYKPPDDEDIRSYRTRNLTDCHSPEYASLEAMLGRLRAHYAAERHKYSK